jgi:hypothetical protein
MKSLPIPCPDGKLGCEVYHQATTETIDANIALHADNCNACVQGENCNTRNKLFAVRAQLKQGNVVGKTDRMTATIQYNKGAGSQMLIAIQGLNITLEQADGLELEKAINRWLHSDDD